MKVNEFVSHLEGQGCTVVAEGKRYTVNNPANGRSTVFGKSGGAVAADTATNVCNQLGIAVPA